MANCANCVHIKVCQKTRVLNPANNLAEDCAEYKDISLFVGLPCKVGDTVWLLYKNRNDIAKATIKVIEIFNDGLLFGYKYNHLSFYQYFSESSIGDFAFFTKEEAEQALAEKKRGI